MHLSTTAVDGSAVYIDWDFANDGRILAGQWRREVNGVIVKNGPIHSVDYAFTTNCIEADGTITRLSHDYYSDPSKPFFRDSSVDN